MNDKKLLVDVEYCYHDGDLAAALRQAADFVDRVGENCVQHVVSQPDENVRGAWWIVVVWSPHKERES